MELVLFLPEATNNCELLCLCRWTCSWDCKKQPTTQVPRVTTVTLTATAIMTTSSIRLWSRRCDLARIERGCLHYCSPTRQEPWSQTPEKNTCLGWAGTSVLELQEQQDTWSQSWTWVQATQATFVLFFLFDDDENCTIPLFSSV